MMFSLATKVLLTMMVFAPRESLAAVSSAKNDSSKKNKTSALTLLLGKTDLKFSMLSSSSSSSPSWTCNNEDFLHHLFPSQSGDPCDCSDGGSGGFQLPRSSTRSIMSQRKNDSFRRHLDQKSTKSPSSSSSGKKKSVTTGPVCVDCCGLPSTLITAPGGCVNNPLVVSTVNTAGTKLYCSWVGTSFCSSVTCTGLGFFFSSRSNPAQATCRGTVTLTTDQCGIASTRNARRKLKEDELQKSIAMKKHNTVMGFLRIPKTGSTTMSNFLATIAYLFGWSDHLSSNKDIKAADGKDHPEDPSAVVRNNNNKAAGNSAISCMFAHVPTTAHLGSNFHDAAKNNNTKGWWNACPHIPYPGLLKKWSKSLDEWSVPKTAVVEQDNKNTPFSFGFQAFSMVREPFDRLVSYFSYLGKFTDTTEFLKETVTEEQYEKVKAGDLHGWMELLHQQGGGCGLKLPYQYHYIHEDLDTAIDMIEVGKDGQAPKVFTLVTECYEASLYLLAEVVEGLEPDHVKDFVNSPGFMSNKNKNSITNQDSYGGDKEEDSLGGLRVLARDWFQDDYVFYDAAVAQFKEYLAKSDVDPVHFKSCVHSGGDVVIDEDKMGEVVAAS